MLINVSVVGTLTLSLLGELSASVRKQSFFTCFCLFVSMVYCPQEGRWAKEGRVLVVGLSLNPAAVPALKSGETSLCLSFLIKHLAYITGLLQPIEIIAGKVLQKKV